MTTPTKADVVVVGAGLSGLTAAYCLQKAGLRARLLEASAAPGGRIRSVRGGLQGESRFDLGPTWVWPRWQPLVQKWISDLDLKPIPQYESGDGILDGFGPEPRRHPLPGQDGIVRLEGGPSAIVAALADRLRPGSLVGNANVVAIEAGPIGLRLQTEAGDVHDATHVVLATPMRATIERIRIHDLSSTVTNAMTATPTWMAQQAKVVAVYPKPFWRGAGLSGRVASRTGPLVEIHDHSPGDLSSGALFGFVGWSASERQNNRDALHQAVVDQLVRCFGEDAATPSGLFIQDWANEPLICSQTDLAAPPAHPEIGPDVLRDGHLGERLWFGGSECADVGPGLIEGALSAGESAAIRVIARCTGSRESS